MSKVPFPAMVSRALRYALRGHPRLEVGSRISSVLAPNLVYNRLWRIGRDRRRRAERASATSQNRSNVMRSVNKGQRRLFTVVLAVIPAAAVGWPGTLAGRRGRAASLR